MATYGTDSDERVRVLGVLALVATAICWLLAAAMTAASVGVPWWLEIPGILAVYGALIVGFESFGWRWAPLRRAFGVVVPDLNGRWTGTTVSDYESGHRTTVEVAVRQTWTRMAIVLESRNSRSSSIVAALTVKGPQPVLTYTYANEPRPHAPASMQAHRGTAVVELGDDGRALSGDYYSGRGRQRIGEITLARL